MSSPDSFSLKDQLFNKKKVIYLADLIFQVYPDFQKTKFISEIIEKFPILELQERIYWIRENLKKHLPKDFQNTVHILLQSLPKPLDPTKTDDDFGDFIFAPLSDFVAIYGCDEKNLEFSLHALERMTQNFSCEDSIRFFLQKFPEKTLEKIKIWSISKNYHIRRLASEGTRPMLPWSQKLNLDIKWVIENILENLFYDSTRYVVRSVANHLNDIAKIDEKLVIKTLKRWKKSNKFRDQKEKIFLISHSLRTLIKKGNAESFELLGYSLNADISVNNFSIETSIVTIGNVLEFSFEITAYSSEKLMIDYKIYFQMKNGKQNSKVFKIKKCMLKENETIQIDKKQRLKIMTTKKLYAGVHSVELQINGKVFGKKDFVLIK